MELLARRYRVDGVLGEGGIGRTYRVHDLVFDVPRALKSVHAGSRGAAETLLHEFLALRGLVHPHLCRVHDFGFHDGKPFYTSTLVAGGDLTRCPAREIKR